jgi:hypothetical protein
MLRVLICLLLAVALSGCATLNHRDRNFLLDHGVSGALYDKMSNHEPLTVDEIIVLSQKGVPGWFIVHYLRPTYYVYKLSVQDLRALRQARVDEGVVHYLLATPGMYSPASVPVWYQNNDPNFYDTHPGFDIY